MLVVIVVGLGVWGATMSDTEPEKAQERVEDYLEGTGQKKGREAVESVISTPQGGVRQEPGRAHSHSAEITV